MQTPAGPTPPCVGSASPGRARALLYRQIGTVPLRGSGLLFSDTVPFKGWQRAEGRGLRAGPEAERRERGLELAVDRF